MNIEVLDPRFDPEPKYWTALRARAGLRADWAWDVLAQQAWCARTPWFITVLLEGGRPCGVVSAAWVSARTRRHRFVTSVRGGRWGGLDVRAPGNSALPGWWFAGSGLDDGCQELLSWYRPTMRGELGLGLRGMLVRQVPESGRAVVDGRWRVLRETEHVAEIRTDRFGSRDDWITSLTKKRQRNLRSIYGRIEGDPALDAAVVPGSELDAAQVAELLRHNERKHHDVPIVPLPQFIGYLQHLLSQPDVFALRYLDRNSGRLVAVATLLDHPGWPLFRAWSALPTEEGGRRFLYFHCYGELVRWAIANGRRGLLLGKKMPELKASLGADLLPQYAAAIPIG